MISEAPLATSSRFAVLVGDTIGEVVFGKGIVSASSLAILDRAIETLGISGSSATDFGDRFVDPVSCRGTSVVFTGVDLVRNSRILACNSSSLEAAVEQQTEIDIRPPPRIAICSLGSKLPSLSRRVVGSLESLLVQSGLLELQSWSGLSLGDRWMEWLSALSSIEVVLGDRLVEWQNFPS